MFTVLCAVMSAALQATGTLVSQSGLDLQQTSGFTIMGEKLNFFRYLSHFRSTFCLLIQARELLASRRIRISCDPCASSCVDQVSIVVNSSLNRRQLLSESCYQNHGMALILGLFASTIEYGWV